MCCKLLRQYPNVLTPNLKGHTLPCSHISLFSIQPDPTEPPSAHLFLPHQGGRRWGAGTATHRHQALQQVLGSLEHRHRNSPHWNSPSCSWNLLSPRKLHSQSDTALPAVSGPDQGDTQKSQIFNSFLVCKERRVSIPALPLPAHSKKGIWGGNPLSGCSGRVLPSLAVLQHFSPPIFNLFAVSVF